MSYKLSENRILCAAEKANIELSERDVAYISAQFESFAVLQSVDVSDTRPMFDPNGGEDCCIARRE